MTTLIDTAIPSEEYLESVLNTEALVARTEDDFKIVYLEGLARRISENPATYRAFGPWWPEVKSLLNAPEAFGESVEPDVRAIYSLSRPALTIIAAHLYSAERIEAGCIYSAYHELTVHEDADDTEPYLYVNADDDMEKLIALRG